jgi:hypothetical protein
VSAKENAMPRHAAILTVAVLCVGVSLPADEPQVGEADTATVNVLANGDFEDGGETPKSWQTIDGLSSFYVTDPDPKHNKVIKLDTDVGQVQAYDWWCEIARGASPKKAPAKRPASGNKSDTLAGTDGAWFWSDPFPITKGKSYRLTIDVKGPEMLAWLVGYAEKPDTSFGADEPTFQEHLKAKQAGKPAPTGRNRDAFQLQHAYRGQMKAGGDAKEWKTYTRDVRPFRPTVVTPTVKWGRILLLPTKPAGEYYIDNVKVIEMSEMDTEKDGK